MVFAFGLVVSLLTIQRGNPPHLFRLLLLRRRRLLCNKSSLVVKSLNQYFRSGGYEKF